MAINPKIKERAEKIRKEVYGKDVREALASGLEVMSEDVEETKNRQDYVESQFQAVLDETTGKDVISAPEVIAARVGADGTQYSNLKQRLDSEHDKITTQLAEIKQRINTGIGQVRPFFKNSRLEKKEIVVRPDSEIATGTKRVDLTQTPSYLRAVKTEVDNPGTIRLKPSVPVSVWSGEAIEFTVMFSDYFTVFNPIVRVYPEGIESEYYTINIGSWIPRTAKPYEPIRVIIYLNEFNTSSTPPSGFYLSENGFFDFSFNGNVGDVVIIKDGVTAVTPQTPVIIQFDDGWRSVYDFAFKEMEKRGIVGTFNVETGRIGNLSGYCTWDELKEMQNAGWTIGNHTRWGTNALQVPEEEAVRAIEEGAYDLARHGLYGGRYFAPVQNAFNSTLEDKSRHILISRKHPGGKGSVMRMRHGIVPITSDSVRNHETADSLLAEYDEMTQKGYYFSCTFHTFSKNGDINNWDFKEDEFIKFLDGLVERNAWTINVEQLVDMLLIPS